MWWRVTFRLSSHCGNLSDDFKKEKEKIILNKKEARDLVPKALKVPVLYYVPKYSHWSKLAVHQVGELYR